MNQIEKMLVKYRTQKEKLEFLIETLERELAESDDEQPSVRKRSSSTSTITLSDKVLQDHPDGLRTQALLAEMRKLGYVTESKEPTNNLNSQLHRNKRFRRLNDGLDPRVLAGCQ